MNRNTVLENDYLDCRCLLLELAATFDRFDRASSTSDVAIFSDTRLTQLRQALQMISDSTGQPDRVARILNLLSEPTD